MMRKLLLTFIVYVQKVARKDLSLNYFLSSSLLKAFIWRVFYIEKDVSGLSA